MKVDLDVVLSRANAIYEECKGYVWDGFKAPEQRPLIASDQVKAVAAALVEEFNEALDRLRDELTPDPYAEDD